MSSSLIETARAKRSNAIAWDEYIHNLLARVGGAKYEENDEEEDYYYDDLREIDPFAWSIWSWSDELGPVEDTAHLEAEFTASRHSTFNDVEGKLGSLDNLLEANVRKSLALLALQERRADVLKLCLEQGGLDFEPSFRVEARRVDAEEDPRTLSVLRDSEFG